MSIEAPSIRVLSFRLSAARGGLLQSHIELDLDGHPYRVITDYFTDQGYPFAHRRRLGRRFILRHGTEPDPKTGTLILTRLPHKYKPGNCDRNSDGNRKPLIPSWRRRAPEISDWDTSE